MTDTLRVSIVVPCHNAEPYLAQAIGSALDQTRPPHELIVVDDGSTDASLAVARRFEASEPGRVRVFSERSGRASRTRNLGALAASGEAIMFLDADDVLAPDALDALAEALARRPDGVAICPWLRMERAEGRWVARPPSCVPRMPGQDPLSAWLTGWYHPPCSVLWSRVAFENAGRWDEHAAVNQDGDLMMRALVCDIPLLETARGSAYYRRRPGDEGSVSAARATREGLASRIRIAVKIACWLEERGRLDQYRGPICRALRVVAADARRFHPDIAADAEASANRYAASVWARARRRIRRALAGSGPDRVFRPRGAAAVHPEEVRFGLDRADQVRAAAPTAPAPAGSGDVLRLARPVVSVIVPTYNRAHLLARAVDGVLAQSYEDFEILIVDDASTDDTAGVLARYADPRIRYTRQLQNAGVSAARNRGLRAARGAFIAFLDSDDEWLPHKLARQVERFDELPDSVGLLYVGVQNEDGRGGTMVRTPARRGNLYRDLLLTNVIHGTSGVMIRRAVVAAAGFFDEAIPAIEDYDYWLRVARFFDADFIEEPLIRYHDPTTLERKSLDVQANLAARQWFYRKHVREMRRAGVAHLFLLTSARRALRSPQPDVRTARRLAAQAVREAPTSRTALAALSRTVLRA